MYVDRVVVNASPLIVLFNSNQEDLLPRLFSDIVVPQAVMDEVMLAKSDRASEQVVQVDWLKTQVVAINPTVAAWDLGMGESSVISHAIAKPGYHIVIDDRAARRCAKSFGLQALGTGRLLVLAKQRGLIATVGDRLEQIVQAGLWLSPQVIRLLKEQAQEQ